MPRTKVLIFIESLAGGGAERVLVDFVENIDRERFDITICSVVKTGLYVDQVSKKVDFKFIIGNSKSIWGRFLYKLIYGILSPSIVYALFVPHGFDVEIAFVEGFATRIIGASNRRSYKVAWIHSDFSLDHWTLKYYHSAEEEKITYLRFDIIVCVSESAKSSVLDSYPELRNLVVIPNPVDESYIKKLSKEYCHNPHFLYGGKRIISVGRLVSQKGYDTLLKVARRLHGEGYDFVINILGDGSEKQALSRYMEDNDMGSYISLMGFQTNPYYFMKQSDLFISCSIAEGFGLVIVEAMLLRLPVISTRSGGADEITDNGQYGELVNTSEDGLYSALKAYLNGDLVFDSAFLDKAEIRAQKYSINEFLVKVNLLLS